MARSRGSGGKSWWQKTVDRNRKSRERADRQRDKKRIADLENGPKLTIGPDGTLTVGGAGGSRPKGTGGTKRVRAVTSGDIARWMFYRAQVGLIPVYAIAATWVVGYVVWSGWVQPLLPAIVALGAVAAVSLGDFRFASRTPEKAYFAVAVALAHAWIRLAGTRGPLTELGPLTLTGWLTALAPVVAAPWWYHHRPRTASVVVSSIRERWAKYVQPTGGVAPGVVLGPAARIDGGDRYDLILPPGKQTPATMATKVDALSGALGLEPDRMFVEPHKGRKNDRASMTIMAKSPISLPVLYRGVRIIDGVTYVGTYPDHSDIPWRLWQPGSGGTHCLIAGTTGSGKSRFVEMLLACYRESGVAVTWIADPESGQSLPDWNDVVDWSVLSAKGAKVMLTALLAVVDARNKKMGSERRKSFDPTPEMPLLVTVLEESPEIFLDRECVALAARIGKRGRKVGVVLIIVVQVPSLEQLGGSQTLRAMVASGNVAVFRTADRVSANMAFNGSLPVDPSAIPREIDEVTTAGTGYFLGPRDRRVMGRAYMISDEQLAASRAVPCAVLDELSQKAAIKAVGDAYAKRQDLLDLGDLEPDDDEPDSPPLAAWLPPIPPPPVIRPVGVSQGPQTAEETPTRPALRTAVETDLVSEVVGPPNTAPPSVHQVWAALPSDGSEVERRSVIRETELSPASVRDALSYLKVCELASNPRVGWWSRVAP